MVMKTTRSTKSFCPDKEKEGVHMKGKGVLITVAIIIIAVLALVVGPYNNLVSLEEDVNKSYSQVQNVMQRRADLIPNLVETVKGYSDHEEEVLTKVTEARSKISSANTPEELDQANEQVSQAVGDINVVAEAYPELKADKNFMALQDELAGTENRISVERGRYNEAVTAYNKKTRTFPTSIVAGIFSFEQKDYFEASPESQEAPEVNFEG